MLVRDNNNDIIEVYVWNTEEYFSCLAEEYIGEKIYSGQVEVYDFWGSRKDIERIVSSSCTDGAEGYIATVGNFGRIGDVKKRCGTYLNENPDWDYRIKIFREEAL